MPPKFKLFLLLSCLFCSGHFLSAGPVDSLRSIVASGPTYEALMELSDLLKQSHPDSALLLANQAHQMATKSDKEVQQSLAIFQRVDALTYAGRFAEADSIGSLELKKIESRLSGNNKEEAEVFVRAYRLMGFISLVLSDLEGGMTILSKGLEIARQSGDLSAELALLTNIGNVHYFQKRLKDAQTYYVPALKIADSLKDVARQGDLANNLGLILEAFGQFDSSRAYYLKARRIALQHRDTSALINTFLNQGSLYWKNGKVDSSITLWISAKELSESARMVNKYTQAVGNLGIAYQSKKDYPKALLYYQEALEIDLASGDSLKIANSYVNLSSLYNNTGDHPKAVSSAIQALELGKQVNELEIIKVAYEQLIHGYGGTGDFAKAYSYLEDYDQARDSLMSLQTVQEVLDLQTKYETEKKDKELAEQKLLTLEEKERNRNLQISFGIGMLLLLLFGFIFYLQSRFQQRLRLQQLMTEQQKKRFSAIIDAEERERTRIARDLHDGLGQLLSTAKMNLSSLDEAVESGGDQEDNKVYNTSVKLLDDAATEVRQVSHNLMPLALKDKGWIVALKNMAEGINASQDGPTLEIESREYVGRLPEEKEIALYRISQEIINNSLKHASAKKMKLSIRHVEKGMEVLFVDNGKGMKEEDLKGSEGIGWNNIEARTELLGGELTIEAPEIGTRIRLLFP